MGVGGRDDEVVTPGKGGFFGGCGGVSFASVKVYMLCDDVLG